MKFDSEVVLNCHRKLKQLAKHHIVTLRLVPSHSKINGNEFADRFARTASERPFTGPELTCESSYGCIKTFVRIQVAATYHFHCKGLTGMKRCKILGIHPYQDRLCLGVSMSRPRLKTLTGILTGDWILNKHMHYMGLGNFSQCRRAKSVVRLNEPRLEKLTLSAH